MYSGSVMNTQQHFGMHPAGFATTKYGPPMHRSPDPIRRHFTSTPPVRISDNSYSYMHSVQGNFFSSFDDNFLARAEALAAVDACSKMQPIKEDPGKYSGFLNGPSHSGSRCVQEPAFGIPNHMGMDASQLGQHVMAHHPPSGFHHPATHGLPHHQIASAMGHTDMDTDPRELERFAEYFKQRRIKLGVTQADVGRALANLNIPGVGSLSQSTICRFESLTLSHNNMVALKPILHTWLEDAEKAMRENNNNSLLAEKKRKRTSIATPERRSLEAYFSVQPRPSSEKIAQIADKLELKKNVVRVWFCNQRQKQKRLKFSAIR